MWARVAQQVFDSVWVVYSYVFVLGFKSEGLKVAISGRTMILAALSAAFIVVGQKLDLLFDRVSRWKQQLWSKFGDCTISPPFNLFYLKSCLRHFGEHLGYMLDFYSLSLEEACSMD